MEVADKTSSTFGSQSFVKVGRLMGGANMDECFASSGDEAEDEHCLAHYADVDSRDSRPMESSSGSFNYTQSGGGSPCHSSHEGHEEDKALNPGHISGNFHLALGCPSVNGSGDHDDVANDTRRPVESVCPGQVVREDGVGPDYLWMRVSGSEREVHDEMGMLAPPEEKGAEHGCAFCSERWTAVMVFFQAVKKSAEQGWQNFENRVLKAADKVPQASVRHWLARLIVCIVLGVFLGGGAVYFTLGNDSRLHEEGGGNRAPPVNGWGFQNNGGWSAQGRGRGNFNSAYAAGKTCGVPGTLPCENYSPRDPGVSEGFTTGRVQEAAAAARPILLEEIKDMLAASGKDGGLSAEQLLRLWTSKHFGEEMSSNDSDDFYKIEDDGADHHGSRGAHGAKCNNVGGEKRSHIPKEGPTPMFAMPSQYKDRWTWRESGGGADFAGARKAYPSRDFHRGVWGFEL
ncbi:unnamed protein product [Discosporangium mesarthrocarpum]